MQNTTMTPTYTDFSDFASMRAQARVDPDASLKQVAKQFEGIFIQMMLKSMREASMGDPIFDSDQSKFYRDMFDQQVALDMSNSKGIGIADAMVRQLGGRSGGTNLQLTNPVPPVSLKLEGSNKTERQNHVTKVIQDGKVLPHTVRTHNSLTHKYVNKSSEVEFPDLSEPAQFSSAEDFTNFIFPYAEQAAKKLGVSPQLLVAQAALETGWGKAINLHRDGTSSYNLFNIKADSRWKGDYVVKSTLEYDNGMAKQTKANFRSYDSYTDSFNDYVNFLRTNARYDDALDNDGNDKLFIKDLHQAGYATDPNYANKVINILKRDEFDEYVNTDKGNLNGHV